MICSHHKPRANGDVQLLDYLTTLYIINGQVTETTYPIFLAIIKQCNSPVTIYNNPGLGRTTLPNAGGETINQIK